MGTLHQLNFYRSMKDVPTGDTSNETGKANRSLRDAGWEFNAEYEDGYNSGKALGSTLFWASMVVLIVLLVVCLWPAASTAQEPISSYADAMLAERSK
jgi:hypothetical protein